MSIWDSLTKQVILPTKVQAAKFHCNLPQLKHVNSSGNWLPLDYAQQTIMDNRPKLRIYTWNVGGGSYQKKSELESFLVKHNVDVMLLQETLHKDHWQFKFPGYQTYKNWRNTTYRGTAILVKDGISHYEYPLNPTQIIATAVIIKASGTEIGVVSTYIRLSLTWMLF